MQKRRAFLTTTGAVITSIGFCSRSHGRFDGLTATIKLGVMADTHIGFVDDAVQRFDSIMRQMNVFAPDGLVQLGDFAYPNEKHQKIADRFNQASEFTVHAIGNHDLDHALTREDCIKAWGIPARYYTRTVKGLRIIVLDGNDKGSPTHSHHGGYPSYIGPEQQDWLEKQLAGSSSPIMIVSHQPLAGRSAIDNAEQLQRIISRHREKVLLCINGHSHVDQQLQVDGVTYLHVNSASYFWLGGKVRLAKYKAPLFAQMTIDPTNKRITVEGVQSEWLSETPEDAEYFTGKNEGLQDIVVPEIRDRQLAFSPS